LLALRSFVDGAVFGEVYGPDAPDVLALHGWGRRGNDFAATLDGLSALAPDLPGFGVSPAPDQVVGADAYADIVARLLDEFARPPVVVGHSFGGRVAVCLAAKHPEKVGPLVITGAPLIRLVTGRRPPIAYRAARWMHRAGVLGDERMERLKRSRGSADYRAATGVMRDILVKVVNESYEGQLRRITAPVHLIWGENDREVPVSVAEASVALLADVSLEVLPGVGHMVPLEAPEALRATVDKARG
jgi:pimeloyl-ACP methyl ester carboxylesterase